MTSINTKCTKKKKERKKKTNLITTEMTGKKNQTSISKMQTFFSHSFFSQYTQQIIENTIQVELILWIRAILAKNDIFLFSFFVSFLSVRATERNSSQEHRMRFIEKRINPIKPRLNLVKYSAEISFTFTFTVTVDGQQTAV